jgi:hypothetical protein
MFFKPTKAAFDEVAEASDLPGKICLGGRELFLIWLEAGWAL